MNKVRFLFRKWFRKFTPESERGREARARIAFPFSRKNQKQRGQATVEYALLIGIGALIGLGFLGTFTPMVQNGLKTFNATLEAELMSGGYVEAATQWDN